MDVLKPYWEVRDQLLEQKGWDEKNLTIYQQRWLDRLTSKLRARMKALSARQEMQTGEKGINYYHTLFYGGK
jgi:hypothetical protein